MTDFSNPLAIKIRKQMVKAIVDYKLIEAGDRLMVCVSGGKDSSVLLALLGEIQKRAPYRYEFEAVMLDQKQPGFDATAYVAWVESLGIKFTMVERDTYSIVKEKVTSGVYCSLCSRLRRGILYDHAVNKGFTKLVLGHHRNDFSETLLLNLFFTGKLSGMPPKLKSDDGRNILVRPLAYVAEEDIARLATAWDIPIMPCNLCGSQEGLKRKRIKKLISDLQKEIPNIGVSMLAAMGNIKKSQLMDTNLWDFDSLKPDGVADGTGVDAFSGADQTAAELPTVDKFSSELFN